MRLMLLLSFSLVFFNIKAQENSSNSLSASIDLRKMDFYFGLDYHFRVKKINFAVGVESGIVKTIFQKRFFPGIHGQIAYPLLKSENFSLAPAIDLNYNILTVQKSTNHPNIFQEYRLGYDLKWGKKFKFMHAAGFGLITEHFYGVFSQKYTTSFALAYSVKMGCLYEF